MSKSKRCFTCNKNKFAILYPINNRPYQIKSALGKCFNCRLCETKIAINKKKYVKYTEGKYIVFTFKPTIFNIIYYYLYGKEKEEEKDYKGTK